MESTPFTTACETLLYLRVLPVLSHPAREWAFDWWRTSLALFDYYYRAAAPISSK